VAERASSAATILRLGLFVLYLGVAIWGLVEDQILIVVAALMLGALQLTMVIVQSRRHRS
jgi:hypothetical protein